MRSPSQRANSFSLALSLLHASSWWARTLTRLLTYAQDIVLSFALTHFCPPRFSSHTRGIISFLKQTRSPVGLWKSTSERNVLALDSPISRSFVRSFIFSFFTLGLSTLRTFARFIFLRWNRKEKTGFRASFSASYSRFIKFLVKKQNASFR